MTNRDIQKSAVLSECRTWRYKLERVWGEGSRLVVIGVNPSTADEIEDDATVKKCMSYASAWGHDGLIMLNLYAYRSRHQEVMQNASDPIGPDNDYWIERTVKSSNSGMVLAAWGNGGLGMPREERHEDIEALIRKHAYLYCLGLTQWGAPKHPLYLSKDLKPVLY